MSSASLRRLAFLCLLILLLRPAGLSADEGRELYRKVIHGVGLVKTPTGQGTCWVADKTNKLLVTNSHVVQGTEVVNVVFPVYADARAARDGRPINRKDQYQDRLGLPARVLDIDPTRDLAILQLELLPDGVEELHLVGEGGVGPGEHVHAIGNPGASDALWVHAEGSVRQVYRKQWAYKVGREAVACDAYVVETQTPTNPGDSGGPTVNTDGEVVAVVSGGQALYRGQAVQAVNWSIEVREVRAFLDQTRRLLNPHTAADHALRSSRALARGKLKEAGEDVEAALKLDPKCALAYRCRGIVNRAKGDLETAVADFDRAVALDPADAEAHFQRAVVFERKGKDSWDQAIAGYTRAIQLNGHAIAYNNRGVIHESRGELPQAFADYGRAIEKNPHLAVAYVNRGDVHRRRGELQQAYADYDRAFGIAPTAYNVQQAAITCLDLGKHELAVNLGTMLVKEYRVDNAVPYRIQGLGYYRLKNYAAAVGAFGEAIRRDPKHAVSYFNRGLAYEELADNRAVADYAKAVEIDPKLADKLKTHDRRWLRVQNSHEEPLRVHLYYETLGEDGAWYWYPQAPPDGKFLTVTVPPGALVAVKDEDTQVKGRRLRIWAEGATSGRQITTHKEKDVALCSREYRSVKEMPFTYTFNKPAAK